MSVLHTDDPKKGDWKATPGILYNLQDPDLFLDDDGKAYMTWGSSNVFPIRGEELNPAHRFLPEGTSFDLFTLDEARHGWERFGPNHDDPKLSGYMEGAWMTKHDGTYYMQYAAPGTEFGTYGDGVYTAPTPRGPWTYAPNNPISYKPGGFINGAGHGSTVEGPGGQWWHVSTMAVAANYKFERRVGMWPTFWDQDGLMYADTSFGDYPHYAPDDPEKHGAFTGWMLLSYGKPVRASSTEDEFGPERVNDEDVKSFWVAKDNGPGQWLQIDLEQAATIRAFQIDYADYKSNLYGRVPGIYEQYVVESSVDGKHWTVLEDRSRVKRDTPNDYTELAWPVVGRYVRFRNLHVPTPKLAIAEFRVFGNVAGPKPAAVAGVTVDRGSDRRDASVRWDAVPGAQGYNVRWGIAPGKLYESWLVYGKTEVPVRSLNVDQPYYFAVEAFDERGVGERSGVVAAK